MNTQILFLTYFVLSDLVTDSDQVNVLTVFERVSINGEKLCHILHVPVFNVELFYAVRAVDSEGNVGHVSNIVRAQVSWSEIPRVLEDSEILVRR